MAGRETPGLVPAALRAPGRMTVYELFRAQVRRDANALAIEQGARHVTYGELDKRVRRGGA